MGLEHSLTPIALAIKQHLEDDASLGLVRVWYGEQELVPDTPSCAVAPNQTLREWQGAPYRTLNEFSINVLAFTAGLQSQEEVQLEADQKAEQIAQSLNLFSLPPNLGGTRVNGMVVSGMVANLEYGFAVRGNKVFRAGRITWHGMSKTGLTTEVSP